MRRLGRYEVFSPKLPLHVCIIRCPPASNVALLLLGWKDGEDTIIIMYSTVATEFAPDTAKQADNALFSLIEYYLRECIIIEGELNHQADTLSTSQ